MFILNDVNDLCLMEYLSSLAYFSQEVVSRLTNLATFGMSLQNTNALNAPQWKKSHEFKSVDRGGQ